MYLPTDELFVVLAAIGTDVNRRGKFWGLHLNTA